MSEDILDKNTILCFDSGIGGLAYLEKLRQVFYQAAPQLNWIYLADSAYFPFGEKQPEQLRERVCKVIGSTLESYPVHTVVLLCNTATICALEELRRRFPKQKFIGTVPAIKPAAAASRQRKIVMLASHTTSKASYVATLHRDFAADCELKAINASKLIDFIEREWPLMQKALKEQSISRVLEPYVAEILEAGADQIVLGCTHFLHLKKNLENTLRAKDPKISLCDSLQGVRDRLFQILQPRLRAMKEMPAESLKTRGGVQDILLWTCDRALETPQNEALRRWEFWAKHFSMQLQALREL